MKLRFSVGAVLAALLTAVNGQTMTAYTDPDTGIQFQRFQATGYGNFHFGIAFPATPAANSEFIGQISGPVNTGYSGISLGGGMVNNLLLLAWADGTTIRSSFRIASGFIEPEIYTATSPVAHTLYTKISGGQFTWTFRCVGCATWTTTSGGTGGFDASAEFAIMGWAQASSGTTNPSNANSPVIQHNNGFGQYGVPLPSARFSQYSSWLAAVPTSTSATAGPTSTTTTTTSTVPPVTGLPVPTDTYDYIVVGGGAGGLVAADRLSETGKSVLLIERGPPSTWATGGRNGPTWATSKSLTRYDVPGLCNQIWIDSVGIACRDVGVMAGCVLGGGTAINAGLFFKPPAQDWNTNFPTGWKSTDMVNAANRVFSRIPSTQTPSQDGKRYQQEVYTLLSNILGGSGWSNVVPNSNPDAKNRTYANTPFMYIGGMRGGPLATYYQTTKARGNVKVVLDTMVDRVVRNGSTIVGVDVTASATGGYTGTFKVKPGTGRVVLSGGAFGTAKILFRSGIGPADQLKIVAESSDKAKMLPEKDWILLPVGYNLVDHKNTDVVISHPSIIPYDFYAAWNSTIGGSYGADQAKYVASRSGPLAGAAPAPNGMAWETIPGSQTGDGIARQLQWTARAEGSMGESGDTLVTVSQYLGTGMTSRGRLGITSSLVVTVLEDPYVKTAGDKAAVVKGLENFMTAAKKISGVTFLHPSPNQTAQQYVDTYGGGQGSNHWMGSAKLGTVDGRNSQGTSGCVVDTNTQVYGTTGLFVVDASIFPGHVTTNPSAPIMVAAEKAVEKILALPLPTVPKRYEQCGGINYTGVKACAEPYKCTWLNDYYFQCL